MRVLLVHPSRLMISEVFLCLEPIGLERVGAAAEAAGHEVRILDLQIFQHRDYFGELENFRPDAVGFSVNYLANVPEVLDLAKATKQWRKDCFVFAGGHSVSFIARGCARAWRGRDRLRPARRRRALDCAAARSGRRSSARKSSRRGHPRWDRAGADADDRPGSVSPRAPSRPANAIATLSANSTPAPQSSSPADAHGTARSAAPGRFTGRATGSHHRKLSAKTSRG